MERVSRQVAQAHPLQAGGEQGLGVIEKIVHDPIDRPHNGAGDIARIALGAQQHPLAKSGINIAQGDFGGRTAERPAAIGALAGIDNTGLAQFTQNATTTGLVIRQVAKADELSCLPGWACRCTRACKAMERRLDRFM